MANWMRITWDEQYERNIAAAERRLERASIIATQSMAPDVESYMKLNAPWTDQTSNARNGLTAQAYSQGKEHGIVLYHQVDYGIWLETRFNGRYAIINPTIEVMGPRLMRRFDRILERTQ